MRPTVNAFDHDDTIRIKLKKELGATMKRKHTNEVLCAHLYDRKYCMERGEGRADSAGVHTKRGKCSCIDNQTECQLFYPKMDRYE